MWLFSTLYAVNVKCEMIFKSVYISFWSFLTLFNAKTSFLALVAEIWRIRVRQLF